MARLSISPPWSSTFWPRCCACRELRSAERTWCATCCGASFRRSTAASTPTCATCAANSARWPTAESGSRASAAPAICTSCRPGQERDEAALLHHLSLVLANAFRRRHSSAVCRGPCGLRLPLAASSFAPRLLPVLRGRRHLLLLDQPVSQIAPGKVDLCRRGDCGRATRNARRSIAH